MSNYADTKELQRHRWYYYKEGFSPNLVSNAVEVMKLPQDGVILDPFNGSGTTTLSSTILGRKSIGIEINPFTAFLSQTKLLNADEELFENCMHKVTKAVTSGHNSSLKGFSTFSKIGLLEKWLFNDSVLDAFEGGWNACKDIESQDLRSIIQLALIAAAMRNCNAKKDGKCLRYRSHWKDAGYDAGSFLSSFERSLLEMKSDLKDLHLEPLSQIVHGDARKVLSDKTSNFHFDLCLTSPPYLNTFDYTDIYRPELFLGKFIESADALYDLRLKTLRSHLQAKWELPQVVDFGTLYEDSISHVKRNQHLLMHKNIPLMIQAYFEDMHEIFKLLKERASPNAQVWMVVSNSGYAGKEIPVDLILAEVGTRAGWFLKEVGVLRNIQKRKTKHSPNLSSLRESIVILSNSK